MQKRIKKAGVTVTDDFNLTEVINQIKINMANLAAEQDQLALL